MSELKHINSSLKQLFSGGDREGKNCIQGWGDLALVLGLLSSYTSVRKPETIKRGCLRACVFQANFMLSRELVLFGVLNFCFRDSQLNVAVGPIQEFKRRKRIPFHVETWHPERTALVVAGQRKT